jgi:hypothetical protein
MANAPNKKGRCFHRPFNGYDPSGPHNLHQAELISGHFAGAAVGDEFERDLLAFLQIVDAGALDCADMDERVCAAIVRLNEAEAFLRVEPFYCASGHVETFQGVLDRNSMRKARRDGSVDF